jgi:hypothetical protein
MSGRSYLSSWTGGRNTSFPPAPSRRLGRLPRDRVTIGRMRLTIVGHGRGAGDGLAHPALVVGRAKCAVRRMDARGRRKDNAPCGIQNLGGVAGGVSVAGRQSAGVGENGFYSTTYQTPSVMILFRLGYGGREMSMLKVNSEKRFPEAYKAFEKELKDL